MTLDGYIRVSRVGGRKGDSFLSPKIQRETIERLALANGVEVGEIVEELDVSGGKAGDDRELGRLIRKIEQGESGGLLVWKVSRFSRSLADGVVIAGRIREAGGRLIGSDLDTSAPMGKAMLGFLLGWAEEELDARREGWRVAREDAVGRGIHIASRAPTGYRRRDVDPKSGKPAGPLVLDLETAPIVHELFVRRAAGAGWSELAEWLRSTGIESPYGRTAWSPSAVSRIIRNRVYLGEARSGDYVKKNAHPAIVTAAEFAAAQLRYLPPKPNASTKTAPLLSGLVRCAGCRYTTKADYMTGRNGERLGLYRCRAKHQRGIECPSPSSALARVLDPYVEQTFLEHVALKVRAAHPSRSDDHLVAEAQAAVDLAEHELREYVTAASAAGLGAGLFQEGLVARQAALDAATEQLGEAQRRQVTESLPAARELLDVWPSLDIESRRDLIRAAVDCVVIHPVRGSGTQVSIGDRATIVWHGEAPNDLPGRGKVVPLRSWASK